MKKIWVYVVINYSILKVQPSDVKNHPMAGGKSYNTPEEGYYQLTVRLLKLGHTMFRFKKHQYLDYIISRLKVEHPEYLI